MLTFLLGCSSILYQQWITNVNFFNPHIGLPFAKADIYNSVNFVMLDTQNNSTGALERIKMS